MNTIANAARTSVRHIAFRIGTAVASAALTASIILGIAFNLSFMRGDKPLSDSEKIAVSVMAAAYFIPMLFGLVILLPQSRKWVRAVGAFVVFIAAPGFLVALLDADYVETFSEEFYWILLWMSVAMIYWFTLRPGQNIPPGNTGIQEGEHGVRGNVS